jgi:hypothetical protein
MVREMSLLIWHLAREPCLWCIVWKQKVEISTSQL